MYARYIKPLIEIFAALYAILLLYPVLVAISILLFIANRGSSSFFIQQKPRKNEKIFNSIKSKTMTDERDDNGNMLPDEQRLTRISKFVRSTSIDELPQLLNILKGDMAFICPRPLLVQYLPLYSEEQHRRHNVLDLADGLKYSEENQSVGDNSLNMTSGMWIMSHSKLIGRYSG